MVERAGLGAPRGAAGALGALALCLRRCSFLGRYSSSVASAASSSACAASPAVRAAASSVGPRADLADVAVAARARANASARARSAGPVAERERRARARRRRARAARRRGALRASTPRASSRSASFPGGGASKRTCWQREAIVGSTCAGRSVSRIRCDVARRLLERLEHPVGGLVVHRVGALEDEHAPARLERRARGGGHDRLVDVAASMMCGAARRDPGQVGVRRRRARAARARGVGRVARRAARRRTRARPRACPSRPGRGTGRRATGGRAGRRRARRRRADGARGRCTVHDPRVCGRGRLITIEGLDGAGKTTLVGRRARELAARGRELLVLREPGGVELSERIRELVKDPALAVDPRAEALLYAAARAQLVAEQLVPLLDARRVGAARPLRRLLARLPGRGPRARRRRDPRDQRVRHRRPDARPHAAAADRPGGRRARASPAARPTASSRPARRSSPRSRAPTTRSRPPSRSASRDRGRPAARAGARRRPRGARAAALAPAPEQHQDRDQEAEPAQDLRVRAGRRSSGRPGSRRRARRPRPAAARSASPDRPRRPRWASAGPARPRRSTGSARRGRRRRAGGGRRLGRRLGAGGALAEHLREVLRELVDELAGDLLDDPAAHRRGLAAELDVGVDRPACLPVVARERHVDLRVGVALAARLARLRPHLRRVLPRAGGRRSRPCPCRASTSARP